jgi:hypothetical protein
MLITLFDDLVSDVDRYLGQLADFLQCDRNGFADYRPGPPRNQAREPICPAVSALLMKVATRQTGRWNRVRAEKLRVAVKRLLTVVNSRAYKHRPVMPEAAKAHLIGIYEPGISDLSKLIERDLSSWLKQ